MRQNLDVIVAYVIMLGLIILVGFLQSWSIALSILCFCLISAVMTMGANIQWGYAGLINFGIMGYTALGGLAAVLVSVPPVREAWQVGGLNMILCAFLIALMVFSIRFILKRYKKSNKRNYGIALVIVVGLILLRVISGPAIESIEAVNPATTGFLGGYVIAFSEILVTYAYRKFFIYLLPESIEPDGLLQLLSTDYKFAVSFSILVVVLLFRPSGIFKGKVL